MAYTLGYTSIGATNGGSERPYANIGGTYVSDVAQVTGEVQSFFIYLNANVLATCTVEIGVYNDSGAGDTPGDLLGTDNGVGTGVAHWEEFDVSAQHIQLTQGQKYYVAAHIAGSTSNRWTYQSSLTGAKIRYVAGLTALPDPWPADSTSSVVLISMYLTYDVVDEFSESRSMRLVF